MPRVIPYNAGTCLTAPETKQKTKKEQFDGWVMVVQADLIYLQEGKH